MGKPSRGAVVERRDFVLGATAAGALLAFLGVARAQSTPGAPVAVTTPPAGQVTWQEAMRAMIGDAQPVEGRVKLELPDTAENGNIVPFTVTAESPMTEQDFVKAVHIFSTGNPKPDVASFYFTVASGKAVVSSRMRLGRTQEILAVAEMSDGKLFIGKRSVKVTIGGCGSG